MRGVMEKYGRIEEVKRHHLTQQGMEHIKVNRVSVKMMKEKDTDLPTMIFGLGSSTSGDERSMWRLSYPGAPRRCLFVKIAKQLGLYSWQRCSNPSPRYASRLIFTSFCLILTES